jgi:hypothetical protein
MASYSYRLPISVSFKKSSTAPVSLLSLNRSTRRSSTQRTFARTGLTAIECMSMIRVTLP